MSNVKHKIHGGFNEGPSPIIPDEQTFFLLLQNGGKLLLQTGDKIIKQDG